MHRLPSSPHRQPTTRWSRPARRASPGHGSAPIAHAVTQCRELSPPPYCLPEGPLRQLRDPDRESCRSLTIPAPFILLYQATPDILEKLLKLRIGCAMGKRKDLLVTEEIAESSDLRATPFEFERAKSVEAALSIL